MLREQCVIKCGNSLQIITAFVFLTAGVCMAETGDGRLIIKNLPDSIEISVNGLSRKPDMQGIIPISPGALLIELKQHRVVVYSSLFSVDSLEEKTIVLECTTGCALLHVITEPNGATLSMNGTILGCTPYLNRFLNPGSYSIMATYPGRIPVVRRIEISADSSQIFSYEMDLTQSVKDSIAAVKRALRHTRQVIQSSVLGGLGIAMAVAGAYCDREAYGYLVKADKASKAYDVARSDEECRIQKNLYVTNRDQAKKPIRYRNILYGASGVFLIGFYCTFVF